MKLLALDTSTDIASVALLTGSELLCEEQNNIRTHARFILPMIEKIMVDSGLSINQLDGIVFGRGPGSFTGLRIACSLAKGLGYANDIGLIPVSNLASIAWSARQKKQTHAPVLAMIDARMHEMYWAYFDTNQWVAEERVNSVHEISVPDESMVCAGVGIDLYEDDFNASIKARMSHYEVIYPSAAAMIELAQFASLKPISAAEAEPIYVRNKVT